MNLLRKKILQNVLIVCIILFGFMVRTYNINWDSGMHLHPDERAIVMFTTPLVWPGTINSFFSPSSSLNPHFFAYGSLPLYLLKLIGELGKVYDIRLSQYDQIQLIGRMLSALFDTGTILILFFMGKRFFSIKAGVLAAFFYSISVLPIQLSHFYAVDTLLTLFTTTTLYLLLMYYERPKLSTALNIGVFWGFALATKTSAIVLISSVMAALVIDFVLILIKNPLTSTNRKHHVPHFVKQVFLRGTLIISTALFIFVICEPYALIDFHSFWQQQQQQSAMTKDAFTFPYTLQYVGKLPYLYELKNIYFWGQGPLLASLSFAGILYGFYLVYKKEKKGKWAHEAILLTFFVLYFTLVGHFAIGFMRYMLPLYPLFCLFGALISLWLLQKISRRLKRIVVGVSTLLLFIWPLSFLAIYAHPNIRIQASNWIYNHVPLSKTLAVEHWDDGLPIGRPVTYQTLTLPLYDPDTPQKWQGIDQTLTQTDYLIIASNRLYVPLMKLTNCQKLYPHPCYKQTAEYYSKLFAGKHGFTKVAEFTSFPTIPFFNTAINDQDADESFTVYDHPKVMIFKKQ